MGVQLGWPDLSTRDRVTLMEIADAVAVSLHRMKQEGPNDCLDEYEEDDWFDLQDRLRQLLSDLMHCFPENRLGPDKFKYRGIRVLIDIDHEVVYARDVLMRWGGSADELDFFYDEIHERFEGDDQ